MKKFRVYGVTQVVVTKEVWANNEDEAKEKAYQRLSSLTAYGGNGGWDKLVGVSGHDESVEADEDVEYNDTELLEEDPSYIECPECGEQLDEEQDGIFHCCECDMYFNSDGEEIDDPNEEDED